MTTTRINVSMATFPPRKAGMLATARAILPQCDRLCIYLNEYSEVPGELLALPGAEKLECRLGPNLSSHGKTVWLSEPGYHLTVDDDLLYPPNYVPRMLSEVDRYGRKAVVGVHGFDFPLTDGAIATGRINAIRVLYPYDVALAEPRATHGLGMATVAFHSDCGLTQEAFCGEPGSGDDEDLALWAQTSGVPLLCIQREGGWIKPNETQWVINPLHRRSSFAVLSENKLRRYLKWKAPIMEYPEFEHVDLSPEDLAYLNNTLSSDALHALVMHHLRNGLPASLIRTADGERAIIRVSQGAALEHYLREDPWLERYGLAGADLAKVGRDLLWAGENATWLACSISGLFLPCFKTHDLFAHRKGPFVDQFWPMLWSATNRVGPVLRQGPVLVLHRDHKEICKSLNARHGCQASGLPLDSWRDHDRLLGEVAKRPERLVLVSGGASGKPFCVRLADATGKVVLDVGEALGKLWAPKESVQEPPQRVTPTSNKMFQRRW